MGTEEAIFIEDSVFNLPNSAGKGAVACEGGGRCVVRQSTLSFIFTHGTSSTHRVRGSRHFEIYDNIFTDAGWTSPVKTMINRDQISGRYGQGGLGLHAA